MTSAEILSRDAFLLGIELRLFWLVALCYGISFLTGVFYLFSSGKASGRLLTKSLWFTAILHTILIIFRTIEGQRPPFQTLYETLSWFAWSANITYLFVQSRWKTVHFPGIFVSGIAMAACLYSLLTRSPEIIPLPPSLQSPWYEAHVVVAFLAYAVFVVSFAVEITHLIFEKYLRNIAQAFGLPLEGFHRYAHRLVLFGFPLLAFAIFSGAAWANDAWGRYWSWDPKETWSLITWTVYAIYLHSRAIAKWRGNTASFLNVLGFICMIMTFLGVNWLAKLLNIPSMHTYAV